jgi:hypothetical protein
MGLPVSLERRKHLMRQIEGTWAQALDHFLGYTHFLSTHVCVHGFTHWLPYLLLLHFLISAAGDPALNSVAVQPTCCLHMNVQQQLQQSGSVWLMKSSTPACCSLSSSTLCSWQLHGSGQSSVVIIEHPHGLTPSIQSTASPIFPAFKVTSGLGV